MATHESYFVTTLHEVRTTIFSKIRDYAQLGKMRLSLTVVFSAGMAFLIASEGAVHWGSFIALCIGGLLITLSANSVNQILEINYDAIMRRTENRPLPAKRMDSDEAMVFAILFGLLGFLALSMGTNYLAGIIGLISHLLYSFVYTPLKRKGPLAVFAGAVPGALPTIIGWAAATNYIGVGGLALFVIQFFWQLPHFWAIAWVAYEDYTKAGYRLMPHSGERNKSSAVEIMLYTMVLIPLSFLPEYLGICGRGATIAVLIASILYLYQAVILYRKTSSKSALKLMFASFLYLPIVLLAIWIDKI